MTQRPPANAASTGDDSFRLLVSAVEDYAILLLDPTGHILTWNAGAERIKGYSADEIVGQHISRFYPDEDIRAGKVEHELAEAERVGRFEDEGWRIRKDGTRFWANVIVTALFDDTGTLTGFGKVTRDLTEPRRFEHHLERAREEAAAANRAKDEFLSSMSHELRTPLNAVLGFSQLLEFEDLTGGQRDTVGHIVKAGHHLLDLINEILDISRIASGTLVVTAHPVDVAEVVGDSVAMVSPLAAARRIRMRTLLADSLFASADRQRLKQVLLNLLSNAIKYNRDDGEVTVSSATSDTGRVVLVVSDTGDGIEASAMTRLFNPFDRLGAESSEVEGTGLGLALSRGLIEAMGGTIEATSVRGEGTRFIVELPAHSGRQDPAGSDVPALNGAGSRGAPRCLLYIEDNATNVHLLRRMMSLRPGVELVTAADGATGLELARSRRPGVVLLDLHLPDTSGEEVLRRLRTSVDTADIAVVAMSALADSSRIRRVLEGGAVDYITKPIEVSRVLAVIDRWCLARV